MQRPAEALNLHFLFSFYGDEKRLEPQRLLGSTARALRSEPVLTRAAIQAMLSDTLYSYLVGADLPEAVEQLRITPTSLNLEEMSKLWSVFFQAPYVLSVAYDVSVVSIVSDVQPREAPPVRTVRVRAEASVPVLEQVLSQASPGAPAVAGAPVHSGDTLILTGQRLLGPFTRVRIDTQEVVPAADQLAAHRVSVPCLLGCSLERGRCGSSRAATPRLRPLDPCSNTLAFLLEPVITAQVVGSAIRVGFSPEVGKAQRVRLVLSQADAPPGEVPRGYGFDAPLRHTPGSAASLDIAFSGVTPGDYLVRVHVDDVSSALSFDPAIGRYAGPRVTIP